MMAVLLVARVAAARRGVGVRRDGMRAELAAKPPAAAGDTEVGIFGSMTFSSWGV